MFEGFDSSAADQGKRRMAAPTGIAVGIIVLAGVGLVAMAGKTKQRKKPGPIEVQFRKPVAAKKPKKAKPPSPKVKPQPKRRRTKRVAKATKKLAPPRVVPQQELEEGDAFDFEARGELPVGTVGLPEDTGIGGVAALPPPPVPETGPRRNTRPIILTEKAVPPRLKPDHKTPKYPSSARKKGLEGKVSVKVVITESGRVHVVKVLRGEEPFVSALLATIKQWRYSPPTIDGVATAAYYRINYSFRL